MTAGKSIRIKNYFMQSTALVPIFGENCVCETLWFVHIPVGCSFRHIGLYAVKIFLDREGGY